MTPRPTRYTGLGYAQIARGLWRVLDCHDERPQAVGPHYSTRTELLADLDRYAHEAWGYCRDLQKKGV